MISAYRELGLRTLWLSYLAGFISFYIIIKLYSNIQAIIIKYVQGFWAEPVTILVAYILATIIIPILIFIGYFKYVKGIQ